MRLGNWKELMTIKSNQVTSIFQFGEQVHRIKDEAIPAFKGIWFDIISIT